MTAHTLQLPNGERVEFQVFENPHKYIDVHLAIAGWLQTFPLDSVVNAWWIAQKRRQERKGGAKNGV